MSTYSSTPETATPAQQPPSGSVRPWIVGLAGLASLAVAMGIGRFAFTPLLPMMLHDGVIDLAREAGSPPPTIWAISSVRSSAWRFRGCHLRSTRNGTRRVWRNGACLPR
ncbi:YbfB/YjiJ family MFS transporter [Diaphorobacter aerolatus]|uniref:YbfB/YjiJ family MFS transporter n=1 Tax=Diaphorobacter aerolatus TaxID=1288495 RepID=UPI00299F7A0C|nr:YbfB/YjiJ family MFS transporter [Diaphorobacter aerolatus]